MSVKYILSYSFDQMIFKFHRGISYDIIHLACASFDDWIVFGNYRRISEIFEMTIYVMSVKYILSYSFNQIVFKSHTCINYDIIHMACASFHDWSIFVFLASWEILK